MTLRRLLHVPAALLLAALLATVLVGCGDEETPTDAGDGGSDETSAQTLEITVEGEDVSPKGDRVELGVGETLEIHVTSDREGELHVHSTPEQELAFGEGETDLELTIDAPGIVEVEDHESDTVIASLEVS